MNRRLRFAGALAALLALSVYFAESMRASVCMTVVQAESAAEAAPAAHAGMDHTGSHDPRDGDRSDPDAPCPPGMGSSCVAVSLPSLVVTPAPALESTAAAPLFSDNSHDLLITAGPFRPPRA